MYTSVVSRPQDSRALFHIDTSEGGVPGITWPISVRESVGGVVTLTRYTLHTQREWIRGQISRAEQDNKGDGVPLE